MKTKTLDRFLLYFFVFCIGGLCQRGVPILSLIPWSVYKVALALLSTFYLGKIFSNRYNFNPGIKSYIIFTLVNVIWISVAVLQDNYDFSYVSAVITYLFPLFPIYYLATNYVISSRDIRIICIFFIIISALTYVYHNEQMMDLYNRDHVTNNIGYYCIPIIPFAYYFKGKYANIIWATLFMLVLVSAKRGALVCLILGFVQYIYLNYFVGSKSKIEYKIYALFALLAFGGLTVYFMSNNEFLHERLTNKENAMSDRDVLYSFYWFEFWAKDVLNWFFGNGFDATTYSSLANHAHNDWIEILYDYGFIGIWAYINLYYKTFSEFRFLENETVMNAGIACISMILCQTFFSMGFNTETMALNTIILGFTYANITIQNNDGVIYEI